MLRSAAYRRGEDADPDHELVRAVRAIGFEHIHGLVALNEAAVAWRSDRLELGRELAMESAEVLHRVDRHDGALLAESLALLCGSDSAADIESVASAAGRCPLPGIAVQALAILHRAKGLSASWCARSCKMAESIPPGARSLRREVLSIEEALDWLQREGP